MLANVNGTRIFFDVEGLQYVPDGPTMREKPVVFLIHGGPGADHTAFLPATSCLADDMQLVYIDDRNCGLSDRGDITTSTLEQNVDDIDAMREYLGLEKIFILGWSYGGMKALRYATKYSDHLHGAIFCCTSATGRFDKTAGPLVEKWGTEEQKELWKLKAAGKITDLSDYMRKMGSLYYHNWNEQVEKEDLESGERGIFNTEVNNFQRYGELQHYDIRPYLGDIKCPTMVFSGKWDFITSIEHGEVIHQCIPGSQFIALENSSHSLFIDQPETVFPCIRTFAARHFVPSGK